MSEHTYSLSRRTFVGGAALVGLSALGLSLVPSPVYAVTAAEKQAEADAALETLNSYHEQADILSAKYQTALGEQQEAQPKMEDGQGRIDQKTAEISALQSKLGERARSMYRDGSFTFLDMLLGATTFQAFAANWDLLNNINKDDATMVQQTKDLRAEVEAEKQEYANQEQVAAQKADEAAQAKAEADQLIAQTQAVYDSLSAEAAELLRQEEEAREAAARAAAEAAERERLAREEEERRRQNQSSAGGGGGNSGGGGGGTSSGGGGGTSSGGGGSYSNPPQVISGNAVVDRAYAQLGKPYEWAACGPDTFDCSGLVSYCILGYAGRVGTTYTFMGYPQVGAANAQPGDIVTNSSHCGVYIGDGMMIHAPHTGDVVKISAVYSSMIYVRYPG